MRYLIATVLFLSCFTTSVLSQNTTVDSIKAVKYKQALHFSSPFAMLSKVGFKIESRTDKIGNLIGVNRYFYLITPFPGTQVAFERRYYSAVSLSKRSENFLYAKLITGHIEEHTSDDFFYTTSSNRGNYAGLGFGTGRKINFRHLFFETNKYPNTNNRHIFIGSKCIQSCLERKFIRTQMTQIPQIYANKKMLDNASITS